MTGDAIDGAPTVLTVDTPTLGDRSYLVHDGLVAFVVDPQRDIDRLLTLAGKERVRITHVFETHLHNDYLTGGLALAQLTGASYHVNAADEVGYDRQPVRDGDVVEVSPAMQVRAMATPGHTFTHLSYVLQTPSPGGANTIGVFTGGSLLYGATGRPDLLGAEHTQALLHHQYDSAHRIAQQVPDDAQVLPTHGFGSFCSAGSSGSVDSSTLGEQKDTNPVLTQDEQDWVDAVLDGLGDYPAYYVHMSPANAAGPGLGDMRPPRPADAARIAERIARREWVVDLRNRSAFAAGHVTGTLNFGIDGQFATYLGWLIPWDTPLTLLGDSPEQVADAQRELVRIGIDRFAGAATGDPANWSDRPLDSFPRSTFADLEQVRHHRGVTILDVRRTAEHEARHIQGSLNIPLHDLIGHLHEVADGEVWVHCASGYRASIAASVLAANNVDVVAVDDNFDNNAAASGLPMNTPTTR